MSVKTEFHLSSSNGKSKLYAVLWLPEQGCETKAVMQLFHGMSEHILRYEELADRLTNQGIAVIGYDHLGHGQTVIDGNFGYFADREGDRYVIKDMHRVSRWAESHFPGIPRFLLGHSMGSFFLRRYLTVYDDDAAGAIIMGTGDQPLPLLLAGSLAVSVTFKVMGGSYRSQLLYELVLGNYNRAFRPNRTDNDWLSKETEAVDLFCEDPYCNFKFTCSAYKDFLRVLLALKLERREGRVHQLPVLFLSGEMDPVGQFGCGVRRVCKNYIRAGMEDVTLKLYPKNRHELLHETDRYLVMEDILKWLNSHLT